MSVTIGKDDHVRGPATAPATVLVYGDYECPYTRALELVMAAEAVSALAGPDAFWRMHDALFADQYDLEPGDLERQARAAGVDGRAYRKAMAAHQFAERVERDVQSGTANGVEGTPSIFINGERYHGGRNEGSLREAIASYT